MFWLGRRGTVIYWYIDAYIRIVHLDAAPGPKPLNSLFMKKLQNIYVYVHIKRYTSLVEGLWLAKCKDS